MGTCLHLVTLTNNTVIHVFRRGGAIHDTLPNETAFPFRSAIFNVGLLLIVSMEELHPEEVFQRESTLVNQWWPEVQQYLTGSYLNYPTLSLGSEYPSAFWGDNLPRLQKVKRKYDPDNVFANPLSVPLAKG